MFLSLALSIVFIAGGLATNLFCLLKTVLLDFFLVLKQGEDLIDIKVEVVEEDEEQPMREDRPCKEEEIPVYIDIGKLSGAILLSAARGGMEMSQTSMETRTGSPMSGALPNIFLRAQK